MIDDYQAWVRVRKLADELTCDKLFELEPKRHKLYMAALAIFDIAGGAIEAHKREKQ